MLVGSSMKEFVNLKTKLTKEFSMKESPAKEILEMRNHRERKEAVEDITNRVRGEGTEEV